MGTMILYSGKKPGVEISDIAAAGLELAKKEKITLKRRTFICTSYSLGLAS